MTIVRKIETAIAATTILALIPLLFAATVFAEDKETSAKEVKKEVEEALEAIKDYSADRRDEAVKEVKKAMEQLDADLDALSARIENKWSEMDREARKDARGALNAMRKQRNELSEWYGGMKYSSSEAWEDVKKGFVKSYETLAKSFEKAADEF